MANRAGMELPRFHHPCRKIPDRNERSLLHEIRKPQLLVLLLAERGSDGKVEHFDPLLGVLRDLVFPADLPGHLEIFLHRALVHGGDDVAVADALALELRALAGKRHPAVTRVALRAPELLLGERREVAHEVAEEMRVEHPFCHIVRINGPDLLGKHQFRFELVGHRLHLGVHGFERPRGDIRGVVRELEPFHLIAGSRSGSPPGR